MARPIVRRDFLVATAAVAVLPLEAVAYANAIHPDLVRAKNPTALSRLLVGCCALSYKKHLDAGRMAMEDFFLKAVELGVHGIDVTAYWLKSKEASYLSSLRRLAFKNGLGFSGVAIRTEMCRSDKEMRAEESRRIREWIDATYTLGASHLRVFGGDLPEGATVKQGIEWVAETMKSACDYAGKRGITLGIESHHGITARASMIIDIIQKLDSIYAGINLDISNFDIQDDEEQYSDIEASVPFATHIHVRDIFTKTRRPIDLERVWSLLVKGGYKGYVSAEYEGEEDPMTGVPKLLDKIKSLCRKYSSV